MEALITLSHGSRHCRAQLGTQRLTAAAGMRLGVDASDAYLEFSSPDLATAARTLADAGYERAVVVPLLFTHAFHATKDVPAEFAAAQQVSGLRLELAEALGQDSALVEVLAARMRADAPEHANIILYPVGTSNRRAAARTQQLGVELAELTGRTVSVIPATGAGEMIGNAGLEAAARDLQGQVHLLPLFVTDGLLLDRAIDDLERIQSLTGAELTYSAPLSTDLSGIVASRYRDAVAVSTESAGL